MHRSEVDRAVGEDLARIPRGGISQNILRAFYNMQRRSDLSQRAAIPNGQSLRASIALVRRSDPAFSPSVDEPWFGLVDSSEPV
jgi:hypothetical protein